MKAIKSKHIMMFIAASLILTASAFAQPGRMHSEGMGKQCMHGKEHKGHMSMIPDMTEQQKEQMEELRTEHLKVMLPLKNQLTEKHARLNTLSTVENVDMKKINKTIDEIGEIKTKMMKEHASHRQEIRKLLTEDQRLVFDMHPMPHKSHPHMK